MVSLLLKILKVWWCANDVTVTFRRAGECTTLGAHHFAIIDHSLQCDDDLEFGRSNFAGEGRQLSQQSQWCVDNANHTLDRCFCNLDAMIFSTKLRELKRTQIGKVLRNSDT